MRRTTCQHCHLSRCALAIIAGIDLSAALWSAVSAESGLYKRTLQENSTETAQSARERGQRESGSRECGPWEGSLRRGFVVCLERERKKEVEEATMTGGCGRLLSTEALSLSSLSLSLAPLMPPLLSSSLALSLALSLSLSLSLRKLQ
eukprot:COSAG03_NODE_2874_length_2388_cov_37.590293_3_plen_148_part_00